MSKSKTFTVPIYENKITLYKDKALLEKRVGRPFPEGLAGGVCEDDKSYTHLVYIEEPYRNDIITLSHEACHLTFFTLEHVGATVDNNNHEVFTYLHDYILSKMLHYYVDFEQGGS